MRKLLFVGLLLMSFNTFGQTNVTKNYTAPHFQGSIKIEDTLGIVNKLLVDTIKGFSSSNIIISDTVTFSTNIVILGTTVLDNNAANTSAILTFENTAGDVQLFRVDATPEGSVTGSIGDKAIDGSNGKEYIKASGSATNTGWLEFQTASGMEIYATLVDTANQTYSVIDVAQVITFNHEANLQGLTHSTVTNSENITIITDGVYEFIIQPQLENTGGTSQMFLMWLAKDTGGGFVDIPFSNIEISLSSNEIIVEILAWIESLSAGDVIRIESSVSSTNVILLYIQSPTVGPSVPSVIITVKKIQ